MRVTVTANEARCIDPQRNNYKFYRTIQYGSKTLYQYGRIGTNGQFLPNTHASEAAATSAAKKKMSSKLGEYTPSGSVSFTVDDSKLGTDIDIGNVVDAKLRTLPDYDPMPRRDGNTRPVPKTPDTVTIPSDNGIVELLSSRALTIVEIAIDDPVKAKEEYIHFNEEWDLLEEAIAKAKSYRNTIDSLLASA